MATSSDDSSFDGFDPMGDDFVKTLNSNYFGGPGFALPNVEHGSKPINILVEKIPEDLKREGLIRAFKLAHVFPVSCKLFQSKGSNKAILNVKSITDATTAIQALNNRPPLNLKVTLAADRDEFLEKKNLIQIEQRRELARHLRFLGRPLNKMGELVSNICTIENLFKVLSTRDEICNICSSETVIRHVHFIVSDEQVIDPFGGLPEGEPITCAFCKTEDGKFIVCGECRVTAYCGIRCQTLGWTAHKTNCVPYQKLTNGSTNGKHSSSESKVTDKPVIIDLANDQCGSYPQPGTNGAGTSQKSIHAIKTEETGRKAKIPEKPKEIPQEKNKEADEVVRVPKKVPQAETVPVPVPVKKRTPSPSPSPPRPLPIKKIINDNGDSKPKPINNAGLAVIKPASFESDKYINPRKKISLNNEVSFIRETKLEPNTTVNIVFSFCYNPSEFYVQRMDDIADAEAIFAKLQETCGKDLWPEARKLKPGNYCAGKFPEDEFWYRAKVLGFKGHKVEVKFIDFGNRAFVDFDELSPLPPELCAIPALAVCCSLKYIKPLFESDGWSKEASKFFEDCLETDENEIPFNRCKIFNEFDGLHSVELSNIDDVKLNDLMVKRGLAVRYEEVRKPIHRMRRNPDLQTSPPNRAPIYKDLPDRSHLYQLIEQKEIAVEPPVNRQPCPDYKEPGPSRNDRVIDVSPPRPKPVKDISPGEAYQNNCLQKTPASYYHLYQMTSIKEDESVLLYNDVDDPTIVYVLGNNDAMLQLCSVLGEIEQTGTPVEPKPGSFVVAPADDGDYYRVLVLDVDGDKSRVFYLDFGNQDLVQNSEILELPENINLKKIPAQGVRCRIDNMDKIENFETRLADRIAAGSPAEIKVVRKISDHEYAIHLTL